MWTECNPGKLVFGRLGRRRVESAFDGGAISSDGGLLLLREIADRHGIFTAAASCFTDHRKSSLIEHRVEELIAQRVLGLACGYEDLNDHDALRHDPLFGVAVGKREPTGKNRRRVRDQGKSLASSSTLNRLELTPAHAGPGGRYQKIVCHFKAFDRLFLDMGLSIDDKPPTRIILDIDATDDIIHGNQEGRFYHGYYGHYCYLPLYVFWGDRPLLARLQTADKDPARDAVKELKPIIEAIRSQWPEVDIWLRGDSGFARDALMSWCEKHHVHYLFGLARNRRLEKAIVQEQAQAKRIQVETGAPARRFKDFEYRTLTSWSRARRVVGKAEQLEGKANPRFVVTSLPPHQVEAEELYQTHYCERGEMENRIKEQQLDLFADRTSTKQQRSNQIRLWFSTLAYVLLAELRRVGLHNTALQNARVGTIRTRLLKIGARIRVSVRRVRVSLSSCHPLAELFATAWKNIEAGLPRIPLSA